MTGAPLPDGADAVAMVEDSERVDGDRVRLLRAVVPPGAAVRGARRRRPDRRPVFAAGHRRHARPWPGCWPASTPARSLVVPGGPGGRAVDRRRAGRPTASPLRPGQIRESNATMLAPLLAEAGCVVDHRGVVPDDEAALEAVLRDAATTCDAIVTSGGVSMGDYDVVKAVLGRIADMRWMQIAIKPAKPFAFGTLDGVPVFGLPGNPVSSLVSFELLARPALRRMMGHGHVARTQPGRRRRRRPAPPARRQGPLRAGHRRRSPTTAATTCARSAPRAATSSPPRPSPTRSPCCPTAPASPPAPTSPSSCSPAELRRSGRGSHQSHRRAGSGSTVRRSPDRGRTRLPGSRRVERWGGAVDLVDPFGRVIRDLRDLGHRPLQLPLHVLHARGGHDVAAAQRGADVRGDRAHRPADGRALRRRLDPPHRRRADRAGPPAAARRASWPPCAPPPVRSTWR